MQIILTDNKTKNIDIKHTNKKIFINSKELENSLNAILKQHIWKGRVGIYTDLADTKYAVLQNKLIEFFGWDNSVKFVRCSYHAKDIESEEEALKYIQNYHKNETGHTGINENYMGLKRLIYVPNLKYLIHKFVNNCSICNKCKFDRKTVKAKFKLTETPTDINQIVHMDIYTNSKCNFLTFIDRFSKFASAYYLEDRNNQTIIEKIRQYKSQKGNFKKLICGNEFKSINIKDFLKNENIDLHLVKPNNHTGNSNIERFHNTICEKIRVLTIENKSLNIKDKVNKAIEYYDNTYHSTTKEKPFNVEIGNCNKERIYKNMLVLKQNYISKRNKIREDYVDERNEKKL